MTTKDKPKRKDAQSIGEDIIDRALDGRYEPSTRDIMNDYSISESTVRKAKQYATRYAHEEYSQIWGYHPERNRYVLVPNKGGQETANAVLGYSARQVADNARLARVRYSAGRDQAYVTDGKWRRARDTFTAIERLSEHV